MKFKDIPKYFSYGDYHVDISFKHLETWIADQEQYFKFDLNPDFQRGHVWDDVKREEYIKHLLRGGNSGTSVFFNCPSWQGKATTQYNEMVCVDGLQRITAIRKFMNNELKVYGVFYRDFTDNLPLNARLTVYVNELQTKADVLKWYLELNSGGVIHTQEELERVKALYEKELK